MACDEARVAALLAGELPAQERAAMDEHLLACEACWAAVQEHRAASRALELLRGPAPAGLAARVGLAVEVAAGEVAAGEVAAGEASAGVQGPGPWRGKERRSRRRPARARRGRRLVALVAGVVVAAGVVTGLAFGTSGPSDPKAVAAVVAMADRMQAAGTRPPRRERVVLGAQGAVLEAFRVHGVVTLVAVSRHPFAMPPASHVVSGSSSRAWMATRGRVGLYCLNAPVGRHSMLVAAPMPAVALPGVLSRLHLRPS